MKDSLHLLCFGAGLVAGMLLYKHSQDTKTLVNKTEKAVTEGVEEVKDKVAPKIEKVKKALKE